MTKIGIIGANGKVGSLIMKEARCSKYKINRSGRCWK